MPSKDLQSWFAPDKNRGGYASSDFDEEANKKPIRPSKKSREREKAYTDSECDEDVKWQPKKAPRSRAAWLRPCTAVGGAMVGAIIAFPTNVTVRVKFWLISNALESDWRSETAICHASGQIWRQPCSSC